MESVSASRATGVALSPKALSELLKGLARHWGLFTQWDTIACQTVLNNAISLLTFHLTTYPGWCTYDSIGSRETSPR